MHKNHFIDRLPRYDSLKRKQKLSFCMPAARELFIMILLA